MRSVFTPKLVKLCLKAGVRTSNGSYGAEQGTNLFTFILAENVFLGDLKHDQTRLSKETD